MATDCRSDNSVEFLQREHARTLQGLHGEINKLQKKCAKLTFELTMGGGQCTDSNEINGTQQLERELFDSQETVSELQCKLETIEYQTALLKHERNIMMKKFEDQMNTKDSMIASLHSQLEEKSNTVAQLVHKLHQMQRMLQKGGGMLNHQEKQFPQPPKDPPPENVYRTTRITRRLRKSNGSDITADLGNENGSNKPLITGSLPSVQFNTSHIPNSGRLSRSYGHTPNESPIMNRRSKESDQSSSKSLLFQRPSYTNIIDRNVKSQCTQQQCDLRTNPSKTILPPITMTTNDLAQIPLPSDPKPPQYNRRLRLAKSQGLTSAPCSLRLSNYGTKNDPVDDKGLSPNKEEGRLLVRHGSNGTALLNHLHHQQESK